jgi:hypothetical protein
MGEKSQLPIEDFVQVVHVLMLIVFVVQDEFSFQVLVGLNVEGVIDVDIQDIPIKKQIIANEYSIKSYLFLLSHKIKFLC